MAIDTTAATAAKKTNPYQYAGKAGYKDPLAQELYQKYNPRSTISRGPWSSGFDQLMNLSKSYENTTTNYIDPLNPRNWGAGAMKDEYLQRGGLGTYEQQAQYPGATNWPTDASGNPLPRLNLQTGAQEYPQATGGWGTTTPTGGIAGGTGSTNSLSSDVLSKMWR